MALIRYATREITAKLVYYGPGLSGKTSNLQFIHSRRAFGKVGELLSLATGGDRTLFFDLLPVSAGTIAGFNLRFQLFTVPGQIFYNKTRKMVLRDADGVVLVADSSRDARERNRESLDNLKQNLHENGLDYDTIPLVLQLNKRDLPDAQPVAEMDVELNDRHVPVFEAIATEGVGVVETLSTVMRAVLADLDRKYNIYRGKSGEDADPLASFDLGLGGPSQPAPKIAPPAAPPPVAPRGNDPPPAPPAPSRVVAQAPAAPAATSGAPAARDAPAAPARAAAPASPERAIADLLAQTVARLDVLTNELRHAQSQERQELKTAIDGLKAPALMSLEEAARYLQVAPATLEALANERAIPCTRLDASSGWLFTKALLDEWVAARSRSP